MNEIEEISLYQSVLGSYQAVPKRKLTEKPLTSKRRILSLAEKTLVRESEFK